MVKTKEEQQAYNKAYYLKNKAKMNARQKKYDAKNKDKIKMKAKKYYQDNREHLMEYQTQYNLDNPEKRKAHMKEYYQRPKNKERVRIYCLTKDVKVKGWIRNGLLDDYDMVWDRYCNTEFCDDCGVKLIHEGNCCNERKCMDHCHETGKFRNILCHKCNHAEHRKIYKNRKKGTFGIHKKTNRKGVVTYSYKLGGKRRGFKSKIDCMCYKYITILRWRANQRSGQNFPA
tara:strand:+ start:645 stop:1334 length:690 start_codon:yes stop_codon:yes gene_type:complete